MTENKPGAGWTWYLLPFFLSIMGGVIAYYALRDRDPLTGKNCLKLGVVSLAPLAVMYAVIFITLGVMQLTENV